MITITKVKVKGFRGFTDDDQEFDLSSPITILFGGNGKGKSSLLNSIEWCVFGNECIGKNTGIRERVYWEVKNRNTKVCYVELEIKENDKKYIVRRLWKSPKKDELFIISPEGKTIDGEEAKKELVKLTKNFSFKDFLTSIYQHQEVIRFFVIQEPKDRNEAIDRLLGLYEYRNIIDGINKVGIKGEILQNEIDNISKQIEVKIGVWKKQIDEKKKELNTQGIQDNEISEDSAKKLALNIKKSLEEFSQQIELDLTETFRKAEVFNFNEFCKLAKSEITRLRTEMPDIKEQNELFKKISEIKRDLNDYKRAQEIFTERNKLLQDFIQENGKIEELENKKISKENKIKEKENEKEKINLLAVIIEKVIKYLKSDMITNTCPVCGTEKEGLLGQLEKDYQEKYKKQLEGIDKELEEKKNELKKIENLISEYKKREDGKRRSEKELQEVSERIRSTWKIGEKEDIEKWLNNLKIYLEDSIKKIEIMVKDKQEKLNKIEENINILSKIYEVLKLETQMEKARNIERSEDWKKLQGKANEFKKFAEKIENIISAIKKASTAEAKKKIESVKEKISKYFTTITNHPMISQINFEVVEDPRIGGNSYEFKDNKGENIIPILSQGNLNVLALSIFLALAESQDSPFNFLIFDDPSQSLGSFEKFKFLEILNNIAEKRNLIISTMDEEFFDLSEKIFTKRKIVYQFKNWSQFKGPQVEKKGVRLEY
jgi:DNA repair exonuclease SbcCD ATPase subunit